MPPPIFKGVHAEFLRDESPELDLEGARSSGKSWVCCAKIILSCLKYPGIEWLAARYSGEETRNKLKPEFLKMCGRYDVAVEWDSDAQCYVFPEVDGKNSKVFMYGLKTQDKLAHFAKIRGLGVACVFGEQAEEWPEDIALEMRAVMRQPGYPHQLIFAPNPPNEDSWIADQFPEDDSIPNRHYYCVSLYDNVENLDPKTISALEQAYPPTHAKHKSLILGLRGPNVTGKPVYENAFQRALHFRPLEFDPQAGSLFEGFDAGKHHPAWLVVQRAPLGNVRVLGGILGKRLLLDDFLPIVDRYREEWFGNAEIKTCCDPPPSEDPSRYTPLTVLRSVGLEPRARTNANAADVRESMTNYIGGLMRRREGIEEAFAVNSDPTHWLMASHTLVKQTKLFVDSLEGSYVWSPLYVSVGNKTVRQPLFDEWLEGWQRCLENIALNFCAGQRSRQVERRGERLPSQVRGTEMDYMA